jgi:hypothetical protein
VFGVSRLRALLRDIEAQLGTLRAAALAHVEGYVAPRPPRKNLPQEDPA